MQTNGPVGYLTLNPSLPVSAAFLQLREASSLYNYAFAGNGVFLCANRPGLEICAPLASFNIRGLLPAEERFALTLPRVPDYYLQAMLDLSRAACIEALQPVEALFHLIWSERENRWRLDEPEQIRTTGSVRPTQDGDGSSYQLALIEVHSHHNMPAFFSSADDADEQGFRIYGVLGHINSRPEFRVRIGCFGHFWEIPAETIFGLPEGMRDAREND